MNKTQIRASLFMLLTNSLRLGGSVVFVIMTIFDLLWGIFVTPVKRKKLIIKKKEKTFNKRIKQYHALRADIKQGKDLKEAIGVFIKGRQGGEKK